MRSKSTAPVSLEQIDKDIINLLQDGFPICSRPFAVTAEKLGILETDLIHRIDNLLAKKVLSRFGPMYHAVEMGGAFSLAAMQIPEQDFENACEKVNSLPEIAHNYERDHALNMWFVIATETPEEVQHVIDTIERNTGYKVYNMPKQEEYYVNLRFKA